MYAFLWSFRRKTKEGLGCLKIETVILHSSRLYEIYCLKGRRHKMIEKNRTAAAYSWFLI